VGANTWVHQANLLAIGHADGIEWMSAELRAHGVHLACETICHQFVDDFVEKT
jgi:hypothetical protein